MKTFMDCFARIVLLLVGCAVSIAHVTRKETAHVGAKWVEPDIVLEFKRQELFNSHADIRTNDIVKHHALVESFCVNYMYEFYKHKCTWREYYLLLDHVRLEYANMYDPGMEVGFDITKTMHKRDKSNAPLITSCEEFRELDPHTDGHSSVMTAHMFHSYVKQNRPFIIRDYAKSWPAVHYGATSKSIKSSKSTAHAWTLNYLKKRSGNQPVRLCTIS